MTGDEFDDQALESLLLKLNPATVSDSLRDQIGNQMRDSVSKDGVAHATPARRSAMVPSRSIRWAATIASLAALVLLVVSLRFALRRDDDTNHPVDPQPESIADSNNATDGTNAPIALPDTMPRPVPPTWLAYTRAMNQENGALDELLDNHARTLLPSSGEVVSLGMRTESRE